MKLINISEEIIGEPYKVEDIHNARQTDFEKQVSDKRNEFESSINVKKPQPVDFSDKVEPEMKIMEMEALIAETMAKRKFDIEQIQGTNPNTNTNINVLRKTVSFDDNVTLHVDDYESINLRETTKLETTDTSNIFNKLKKTAIIKDITPVITTDDKLNQLNNKIEILVQMMGQILSLLEKRETK
jgi:phage tail sheath protein FI